MLYREAGQFKSNYAADVAIFPILQDRIGLAVILFIAAVIIPWFGSTFLIQAVMIPFLIFSLAAIGLNLLTGYTGLLMASPRTADPAIVARAIEEIASACRGGQAKLALMLLGRLVPEFEHNADGSAGEVRA